MAIDPTQAGGHAAHNITSLRPPTNTPARETPSGESAAAAPASARFHASPTASGANDVDTARVNELRDAIARGDLAIDTDRIADSIIESARELVAAADSER